MKLKEKKSSRYREANNKNMFGFLIHPEIK